MELIAPEFINTNAEAIIAGYKAEYELLTGVVLAPGQAEMLLIQAISYREQLLRIQMNEAAKQNLLSFARYPMIDYLGELVGVVRLAESEATCTLNFTLVVGHPQVIIPANTRVQSIDGKVVFSTLVETVVIVGVNTIAIAAVCTTKGIIGNGYVTNDIAIILDPVAFVASASNAATTGGGANQESDDALRERIKLAPSSFSNAGPRSAYKFFAKSAHPAIIDVGITSPVPGQVNIYPLIADGVTPSAEILNAVSSKLSDDKVRPLSDTVVVLAPTVVAYNIAVGLTLLTDAVASSVTANVTALLNTYAKDKKSRLGVDVILSQIIAEASVPGVYKVAVTSPLADVVVSLSQVAVIGTVTVTILGFSNE